MPLVIHDHAKIPAVVRQDIIIDPQIQPACTPHSDRASLVGDQEGIASRRGLSDAAPHRDDLALDDWRYTASLFLHLGRHADLVPSGYPPSLRNRRSVRT